jgi:hypothetical protein
VKKNLRSSNRLTWHYDMEKSSTGHCSNSFGAAVPYLYTKTKCSAVSIPHRQEIGSNLEMQWPVSGEHLGDGEQEVGQDIHRCQRCHGAS